VSVNVIIETARTEFRSTSHNYAETLMFDLLGPKSIPYQGFPMSSHAPYLVTLTSIVLTYRFTYIN